MNRDPTSFRSSKAEWVPTLLVLVGGLFFVAFVVEQIVFFDAWELFSSRFIANFATSTIVVCIILYSGYWLDRSELPAERYPRIGMWVLANVVVFLAINTPLMVVWAEEYLPGVITWGRFAASLGALGGVLIGILEARAFQRKLSATQSTVRAEEAERQRQWLDYLNGVLRHEVLNNANVITGYASLLLDDENVDEPARSYLETIQQQGQDLTAVIRDVQVLIDTTNDAAEFEEKDLTATLTAEVEQIRDLYGTAEIDATMPDGASVMADDLLPRVFSNLLRNAVVHNDSDQPEISVTVEQGPDAVVVRIADNGPGVPPSEQSSLFERSENTGATHGLGLYLVRTLVERYGGTVELTETGSDGSVFTVELPSSTADAVDEGSSTDETLFEGVTDHRAGSSGRD